MTGPSFWPDVNPRSTPSTLAFPLPHPPANSMSLAERIGPSRTSCASTRARVVGLVGGVGCGKSTVTDAWYERRHDAAEDTLLVDGDTVGHEVRDQPAIQEQIVEAFGPEVLGPDRQIDRQALGATVFASDAKTALQRLNAIMHPAMRAEFRHRIETTAAPLVLFDAAILLEAGWDDLCHEVVFLDVSDAERLSRVAERGWSEEQWRLRENAQWPLDRKRAAATIHAYATDATADEVAAALGDVLAD